MGVHTASLTPTRRRSRTFAVIALLMAAWLGVAGTAYAVFLRQAVGTITVETQGPTNTSLTLYQPVSPFTQTDQTRLVVLRVDSDAGTGTESYTKYRLAEPADVIGPCSGYMSFSGPAAALPGGAGVTLRNLTTGQDAPLDMNSAAPDRRTAINTDPNGGQQFTLYLAPDAPQACANQTVSIDIALELIQ